MLRGEQIAVNTMAPNRLQLEWFDVDIDKSEYKCVYTMRLYSPLDVRLQDEDCLEVVINMAGCGDQEAGTLSTGSGPDDYNGEEISLPFRDGAHIMYDHIKLKLPMYVIYKDKMRRIFISPGDVELFEKREKQWMNVANRAQELTELDVKCNAGYNHTYEYNIKLGEVPQPAHELLENTFESLEELCKVTGATLKIDQENV